MSAPAKRIWNLEDFRAAMLDEGRGGGGPDAVAVLDDCLAWTVRWHGHHDFSGDETETGPLYLIVPDRAGEWISVLSLNLGGDVGVRYIDGDTNVRFVGLRGHPPYDDEDALHDLAERLSDILGTTVPVTEKAFNVKLEFLRSPEVREAFFGAFDEVALRLLRQRGWSLVASSMEDQRASTAASSRDRRFLTTAGPDQCPAYHGGMVGYWLCELPRGHSGWHSDTQDDGEVWMWQGMEEVSSCLPEYNRDLTGHVEHEGCTHG